MVGTSCPASVILITISLGFTIYCESPADFYDQFLIGSVRLLYNVIQLSSELFPLSALSISYFPGRQVKFWVRFLPLFTNIKTLSIKKISKGKEIIFQATMNTLWSVSKLWKLGHTSACLSVCTEMCSYSIIVGWGGSDGWVVLNFRPKVCNIKIQNANLTLRTRNQFCTTEKPCNHRSLTGETVETG